VLNDHDGDRRICQDRTHLLAPIVDPGTHFFDDCVDVPAFRRTVGTEPLCLTVQMRPVFVG